ncbi:hypothetical protein [Kluyvera chengduensis]|uniref:hypothetical protein n=1 Tax=Kluyvera sp. 142359 TaxID=3375726 RepID=UPI003771778D
MTSFLAMAWEYIFGAIGIVATLFLTWQSGKSKGQTETQAKADVKEAKAAQAQAAVDKQVETTKAVKDVAQAICQY